MKGMNRMNRCLAGAVLVLAALLCVSAYTQIPDKDGFPEGRNFKDGTVWVMTFARNPYGQDITYFNAVADVWKKQQEALKKEGIILSYKVLQPNAGSLDDYNAILMTEYKDFRVMEENADKQTVILRKIASENPESSRILQDDKVREFFGTKVVREVVLR
jgi:hypothetical protein